MSRIQSSLDRRKPSPSTTMLFIFALFLLVGIPVTLADKTAADYFVHSLPGQPDGPLLRMHAGHIEVTPEHNGNLFFWHYQNRHIADRPRTVIWLNGGPGCSSEDGGLMEIGPYRVGEGGKLRYNDGSWDEFANLLFVDNPVGTGYSYVNGDAYLHELDEMADQFVIFLEKWFTLFPEYEHDDLYISGESYAGQHIPYIAKAVQDRNAKLAADDTRRWNLKGLLIGNGWISPVHQYQAYAAFAYDAGLIQGGTPDADALDKSMSQCLEILNKPENQEKVNVPICENVLSKVLELTRSPEGQCINMYDIRLTDSYPSCGMNWPPDLETVTPYLRRNDVVAALHINKDKREGWSECSGAVSSNFRAANSKPAIDLLPGLLESGVPIVLFSGDKDMICNHIGTEDMIADMKWSGGQGFETAPGVTAPRRDWEFEKQPAGIYQEARNLTYVKFFNSSHMVPFDYPRRSRDMLDRFMGVDIASIGGVPADSRLDGEKAGSETSVGGHTNSTAAIEEEKAKLRQAELKAYYRSGEAVLVFVIIAASIFGWWVWRQRRRGKGWAQQNGGLGSYMSLPGRESAMGLNGSAMTKQRTGDIEAGDFDESELDNLQSNGRTRGRGGVQEHEQEPYDLASDSEDEEGGSDVGNEENHEKKTAVGNGNGAGR